MALHITTEMDVFMNSKSLANGLVFPMQRGPFQNSGASPWYTPLSLGTPGQALKLAIDTGTNITWITSTLCPDDQCQHFATGRFDYQASSTFAFTDCLQRPYSFGPWGTMQVETGTDTMSMADGTSVSMNLFLAASYSGEQFRQLDWDGGIGLPASSAYVEGRSSFLFQELLRSGQIDPAQPYISFDWDPGKLKGTCRMGGIDESKTRGPHLFLPWSRYSKIPGFEYIWSTTLGSYSVGGEVLASDVTFALDSGSSQFKGDDHLMSQTLERIARGNQPDIVLGFADGEITLGASLYNVLIEQGPQKGQTIPQFAPLGIADLVLVGSLVMEHCYTVHEYRVVQCSPTVYSLAPVGIWLFNRPDGPKIITRSSAKTFKHGQREVVTKKITLAPPSPGSIAGTWTNDYGSVMTLTVSGHAVSGFYQSSTGSTGLYEISGFQLSAATKPGMGVPLALAIEWHSIGEDPADPSWNWCSGLCGQLSLTGQEEVLTLSHILVASSDYAGLARQGDYLDKLTYRRASPTAFTPAANALTAGRITENALAGQWQAPDGTRLKLTVEAARQGRFGRVRGRLTTATGHADIFGFTDINATSSGLALQSLSLTAAQNAAAMTLTGTLDIKEDVLNLLLMTSVRTPAAQSYVQTQIAAATFRRMTQQG